MIETDERARSAIQRLLNGEAPNGTRPDDCGGWDWIVAEFETAYTTGGAPAVRKAFDAASKANKQLARLIAGTPIEHATYCPALPTEAQAIYQHLAPCGSWLEQYVAFASAAAPMTPLSFHEIAGLFAVSMAVARRLALRAGILTIYPNLYFLFVSPSTIDHKTTGLKVLEHIINNAGLTHLLMPRKGSPQALVADLDHGKLPSSRQMRDLEAFLARRAFAAQRGWVREEASALFASLKQEFNAGLLELILELYDCPTYFDDLTISRGEVTIKQAYLSFFGVSTPIEMAPHFSNLGYWSNGLWARCMVLTPSTPQTTFTFLPESIAGDDVLSARLRAIYRLFPIPVALLEETEDARGNPQQYIALHNDQPPAQVVLAPGVWSAWEAYSKATTHTLLHNGSVDQELYACYGRLGTLAMKVAMLLAAMDSDELPITVDLRHFASAQQRVESWRAGLHRLWEEQSATSEGRLTKRVLDRLAKQKNGMTARDLCQALRETSKQIGDALGLLERAGKVSQTVITAGNGRKVEVWAIESVS